MNKKDNPIVLSFHESLLRMSDVELLRGPHWLNDTIISFFFEYLERMKFPKNNRLLFVSPEVTQCIKVMSDDEVDVFLNPLDAKRKDFIFFALNDNEMTDHSGGSHWSLLVLSRREQLTYHYDSSRGSNQDQAAYLSKKLLKYLGLQSYSSYVEGSCLQQKNGYDCGIHVLCNAELLADFALKFDKINGCPLIQNGYDYIDTSRSRLLNLVYSLK